MSLYGTKPDLSMYSDRNPESGDEIAYRLSKDSLPRGPGSEFYSLLPMASAVFRVLKEDDLLILAARIDDEFRRRIARAHDAGISEDWIKQKMIYPLEDPHFLRGTEEAMLSVASGGWPIRNVHACPVPDGDLPEEGSTWGCSYCGTIWEVGVYVHYKGPPFKGPLRWVRKGEALVKQQ